MGIAELTSRRRAMRPAEPVITSSDRVPADSPDHVADASTGAPERAGFEHRGSTEAQGIGTALFKDLVQLLRADAVSEERGDHGARARSDVEIEALGDAREDSSSAARAPTSYMPPTTPPPANASA